MHFRDEGIVVGARRLGEHQYILYVFTKDHGLRAGMLAGVKSLGLHAALCTGSLLEVSWRARLEEHLGRWTVEGTRMVPHISSEQGARCMLMGGLLMRVLAQGDREELFYEETCELMQFNLEDPLLFWAYYNLWEKKLLAVSGFGLDCRVCAVTGQKENLRYISPRSGKAVSEAGAGIYKPRLLPLPKFWQYEDNLPISRGKPMGKPVEKTAEKTGENMRTSGISGTIGISEVTAGLTTTAYFLRREDFLDSILSVLRSSMIKGWITASKSSEH